MQTVLHARFIAAREAAGMTLADVAAAENISVESMRGFEEGPVRVRPKRLRRLAKLLGVTPDYLRGKGPRAAPAVLPIETTPRPPAVPVEPETTLSFVAEVLCDGHDFAVRLDPYRGLHTALDGALTRCHLARRPYFFKGGPYQGWWRWECGWECDDDPKIVYDALVRAVLGRRPVQSYEAFIAPFLLARAQPDSAALARGVRIVLHRLSNERQVVVAGSYHSPVVAAIKTFRRHAYLDVMRAWAVTAPAQEVYEAVRDVLPCPPGEIVIAPGHYRVNGAELVPQEPAAPTDAPAIVGARLITSSDLAQRLRTDVSGVYTLLVASGHLALTDDGQGCALSQAGRLAGAVRRQGEHGPYFMWPEEFVGPLREARAQRKLQEEHHRAARARFEQEFVGPPQPAPHWRFAAKLRAAAAALNVNPAASVWEPKRTRDIANGFLLPDARECKRMAVAFGWPRKNLREEDAPELLRETLAPYGPPWPGGPDSDFVGPPQAPPHWLFGQKLRAAREALGIPIEKLYWVGEQERWEGGRELPRPRQCRVLGPYFGVPSKDNRDQLALTKLKAALAPYGPPWPYEPPPPPDPALTFVGPLQPPPYAHFGAKLRATREAAGLDAESLYGRDDTDRYEAGREMPTWSKAATLCQRFTGERISGPKANALPRLTAIVAPYGPADPNAEPLPTPHAKTGAKLRAAREALGIATDQFYESVFDQHRFESGRDAPTWYRAQRLLERLNYPDRDKLFGEESLVALVDFLAPYGPPWKRDHFVPPAQEADTRRRWQWRLDHSPQRAADADF